MLLRNVRAVLQDRADAVPDACIEAFMSQYLQRIGEAYLRTRRNTIAAVVQMLSVLEHNPGTDWHDLIERVDVGADTGDDLSDVEEVTGARPTHDDGDDDLVSLRL